MYSLARTLARGSRGAALLFGFALLSLAPAPASAQTPVVFGDTISAPGLYFLAGNQSGSGTGLTIESDDVTLLLSRFTLRGDGSGFGIVCQGNDNVVIHGGRITRFLFGIDITDGNGCTVTGVRVDNCVRDGVLAIAMVESWFLRMRCDQNAGDGIDARQPEGCRFVSILAHDNGDSGILISASFGFAGVPMVARNKVRLCWAAYNARDGIRIVNTDRHDIVQNECVNNGEAGIRLFTELLAPIASQAVVGPRDVLVKQNWCVFNREGIVVDRYALDNTLTNNTALANFGHDLVDDNAEPPCANTWFLNLFLTKDGDGEDCIF